MTPSLTVFVATVRASFEQVLHRLSQGPKCGLSDPVFDHLELAGTDDRKSPNAIQGGPPTTIVKNEWSGITPIKWLKING